MNINQFIHTTVLCVLLILLRGSAWADFKATPEEQLMCSATIYNHIVPGNPNWAHMHHFCDCVRFTNRAYGVMGKNKTEFSFNLTEAMDGCNYVIGHTKPDFEFLPDIYLQKATIYSLMGKDAFAAAEYTKALNGNQKLANAYIGMAKFFKKTGDKKKALEIITTGLNNNPESKALKRMYKEFGGTMPYPTPTVTVAPILNEKPDVSMESTLIAPVDKNLADRVGNIPGDAVRATLPSKVENQEVNRTPPPISLENPRETGTPNNPWCRFCPDTQSDPTVRSPSIPGVVPKANQ